MNRPGGVPGTRRGVTGLRIAAAALVVAAALRLSPLAGQSDSGFVIAVGSHSLTVPWHPSPMAGRFNAAVMLGADRPLRTGARWRLSLGLDLELLRDHWWMTGVSLTPEIRLGRVLPGGVQADVGLGVGYMHYVWRRRTLELRDGRYVEATRRGKPSLLIPLSATLRYQGERDDPLSVSPFVSLRWGAQLLFLDEVPVMTHLSLVVGVRIRRGEPGGGRSP